LLQGRQAARAPWSTKKKKEGTAGRAGLLFGYTATSGVTSYTENCFKRSTEMATANRPLSALHNGFHISFPRLSNVKTIGQTQMQSLCTANEEKNKASCNFSLVGGWMAKNRAPIQRFVHRAYSRHEFPACDKTRQSKSGELRLNA